MSDTIEIRIGATNLTPDRFLVAVRSFLEVVQGISRNISGSDQLIHWVVEVDRGSSVVRNRVTNPSKQSAESIEAICKGLDSLRSGINRVPYGFTIPEVRASRALVSVIGGDVQSIIIKNGSSEQPLSQEILRTADVILLGEKQKDFGSVEGRVTDLSEHERFTCSIYDPVYRQTVVCYLQSNEAQDVAARAFRKRVLVSGLIHYSAEGWPDRITADSIRIFPEENELPSLQEIQAIYRSTDDK